jgi:hypothetical protein
MGIPVASRSAGALLAAALVAAVVFSPFAAAQTAPLPYRFLLVISDQWKDPASYVIEDGG